MQGLGAERDGLTGLDVGPAHRYINHPSALTQAFFVSVTVVDKAAS